MSEHHRVEARLRDLERFDVDEYRRLQGLGAHDLLAPVNVATCAAGTDMPTAPADGVPDGADPGETDAVDPKAYAHFVDHYDALVAEPTPQRTEPKPRPRRSREIPWIIQYYYW